MSFPIHDKSSGEFAFICILDVKEESYKQFRSLNKEEREFVFNCLKGVQRCDKKLEGRVHSKVVSSLNRESNKVKTAFNRFINWFCSGITSKELQRELIKFNRLKNISSTSEAPEALEVPSAPEVPEVPAAILAVLDKIFTGDSDHLFSLENLDILEVAENLDQINSSFESRKSSIDDADKLRAEKKMAELREMAIYSSELVRLHFKKESIPRLVNFRLQLKYHGITESLPKKLTSKPDDCDFEYGIIYDEKGKEFDNLRSNDSNDKKDSVQDAFEKFCVENNGDINFINNWYESQGKDSWGYDTWTAKSIIVSFLDIDEDNFYWSRYQKKMNFELFGSEEQLQLENTILMQMAFTAELLYTISIPGVDQKSGTVTLYRTENAFVMEDADLIKTAR
jgi:hypothetical protein